MAEIIGLDEARRLKRAGSGASRFSKKSWN